MKLQSLKEQSAQKEQTQEEQNCTLQELEKTAEEINVSSQVLRDAAKIVLIRRATQEFERQD